MKPDWKSAPEWAQWLAQDEDGYWRWHGSRPAVNKQFAAWYSGGPSRLIATPNLSNPDW